MSESDSEFIKRLKLDVKFNVQQIMTLRDAVRLFALARKGAEGWRPIETAPRGGGPILLFDASGDEDHIGVGFYEPVTDDEGTVWVSFWENGASCQASHWMPVPPPPEGYLA